jgi:hypothetical protein
MAKSPSPFAGMKLTEQAGFAQSGLDQKLFSRPTPLPEKPVPQEVQEKGEQSFIVDRFKNKKPIEHIKTKKPR